MIRQPTTLLTGLGVILAAFQTTGCRPQLAPSEDAIIDYVRSARVHGKVRRVWAEGQEYVDAVLKADAELQKELAPLRQLAAPDALWPRSDPRWQDETEIAKQAEEIVTRLEGCRPKRELLLGKLGEAIQKTPNSLNLASGEAKGAFVKRVWDALAIDGTDLRDGQVVPELERIASAHLELNEAVRACAGSFDVERPGLNFKDPDSQGNIDREYDALQERLTNGRAEFVSYAERTLAQIAPRLKSIDKKKDRSEYQWLTYQSSHLTEELGAIPKRLQAAIKRTEQEIEQIEADAATADQEAKAKLQAKSQARRQSLELYRADLQNWKPRVEGIVDKFKEVSRRHEPAPT